MSRKFSRIVSVLMTLALLFSAVIPAFAAETAEEDNSMFKPKLVVKVETDESVYAPGEEIVFNITVTNIGLGNAKRVFLETNSHKHMDLDDDQKYIVVGELAAGESKTVELFGRYADETNATLMSRLLLKTITPMYEFLFTVYATLFAPMFFNNMGYCEVNFYDEAQDLDKDYGVLVFVRDGNLPGEVVSPSTAAPTEAPTEEDFEVVEPEVSNGGFVEVN